MEPSHSPSNNTKVAQPQKGQVMSYGPSSCNSYFSKEDKNLQTAPADEVFLNQHTRNLANVIMQNSADVTQHESCKIFSEDLGFNTDKVDKIIKVDAVSKARQLTQHSRGAGRHQVLSVKTLKFGAGKKRRLRKPRNPESGEEPREHVVQTRVVHQSGGGKISHPKQKPQIDLQKLLEKCVSSNERLSGSRSKHIKLPTSKELGSINALTVLPYQKSKQVGGNEQVAEGEAQQRNDGSFFKYRAAAVAGPSQARSFMHRTEPAQNPLNNVIIKSLRPEIFSNQCKQWTQAPTISVGENLRIEARSNRNLGNVCNSPQIPHVLSKPEFCKPKTPQVRQIRSSANYSKMLALRGYSNMLLHDQNFANMEPSKKASLTYFLRKF